MTRYDRRLQRPDIQLHAETLGDRLGSSHDAGMLTVGDQEAIAGLPVDAPSYDVAANRDIFRQGDVLRLGLEKSRQVSLSRSLICSTR